MLPIPGRSKSTGALVDQGDARNRSAAAQGNFGEDADLHLEDLIPNRFGTAPQVEPSMGGSVV
jgi:hypothetical protein